MPDALYAEHFKSAFARPHPRSGAISCASTTQHSSQYTAAFINKLGGNLLLVYVQCLTQCLAHCRYSINAYGTIKLC